MLHNEFNQAVAIDFAPHNSLCEWCRKPAVQQLTAIGGKYHNKGGFFCLRCGEVFAQVVARVSDNEQTSATVEKPLPQFAKTPSYLVSF